MRAKYLVPVAVLCTALASCSSGAPEDGDAVVVTQYATEVVDGSGGVLSPDAGVGAETAEKAEPGLSDAEAQTALGAVCGAVDEWQETVHPSLGRVYVGLKYAGTGLEMSNGGCIGAVDATGDGVFRTGVAVYEDALNFASPFQDSTGNIFVTYNPGRYNGVITLVPTPDGFAQVGDGGAGNLNYQTGENMYYYADLVGPGADGRYQIEQSANDCTPSCAGGTITSELLSWNGTDYS
ncbi:hypothetical protein [uncultured Corynebacterium sp.]|uniref:hypothetical protein n=1 Tax=uncultured Corynebacterium sp. TaxID=159447 RepID=UPI0025DF66A2|nr:hypothetical protein [uncultured Corynebacterium sp.]